MLLVVLSRIIGVDSCRFALDRVGVDSYNSVLRKVGVIIIIIFKIESAVQGRETVRISYQSEDHNKQQTNKQ